MFSRILVVASALLTLLTTGCVSHPVHRHAVHPPVVAAVPVPPGVVCGNQVIKGTVVNACVAPTSVAVAVRVKWAPLQNYPGTGQVLNLPPGVSCVIVHPGCAPLAGQYVKVVCGMRTQGATLYAVLLTARTLLIQRLDRGAVGYAHAFTNRGDKAVAWTSAANLALAGSVPSCMGMLHNGDVRKWYYATFGIRTPPPAGYALVG